MSELIIVCRIPFSFPPSFPERDTDHQSESGDSSGDVLSRQHAFLHGADWNLFCLPTKELKTVLGGKRECDTISLLRDILVRALFQLLILPAGREIWGGCVGDHITKDRFLAGFT